MQIYKKYFTIPNTPIFISPLKKKTIMKTEQFDNYIKITADDGCVITSYKEGDDILAYSSCKIMYAPKTAFLGDLRDINDEMDAKYNEEKIIKGREVYGV